MLCSNNSNELSKISYELYFLFCVYSLIELKGNSIAQDSGSLKRIPVIRVNSESSLSEI